MNVAISEIDTVEKLALYRPDLFEALVEQGRQQFRAMFLTACRAGIPNPLEWAEAQLN